MTNITATGCRGLSIDASSGGQVLLANLVQWTGIEVAAMVNVSQLAIVASSSSQSSFTRSKWRGHRLYRESDLVGKYGNQRSAGQPGRAGISDGIPLADALRNALA